MDAHLESQVVCLVASFTIMSLGRATKKRDRPKKKYYLGVIEQHNMLEFPCSRVHDERIVFVGLVQRTQATGPYIVKVADHQSTEGCMHTTAPRHNKRILSQRVVEA